MKHRFSIILKAAVIALFLLAFCFFLPEKHAGAVSLTLAEAMTQVHDGSVDYQYYAPLYLANGKLPISWTVSQGSLPPGLSLTADSAGFAYISGYPSKAGTYGFTIKATDVNNNQGSWQFTVRIAAKDSVYRVTVTGGEAHNIYGHAATAFKAGEAVTLAWRESAPAGYCLSKWICPASVDLNDDASFYMPAENVSIEAQYTPVIQGDYYYADVSNYVGGVYGFSATEEHTLDIAWQAGLIGRRIEYDFAAYDWYEISYENRYYDLDKDGTDDLQMVISYYSTGQVSRFGGAVSGNSLPDLYVVALPDSLIAQQQQTLYEVIEYFLGHHLERVDFQYATCEAEGTKEHYHCTDCDARFWDKKCQYPITDLSEVILPPYGHSMTYMTGSKPTCTEGGLIEHYECSECWNWYYDPEGKYLVEDHEDVFLPANGHDMEIIGGKKPGCTSNGVVEHYECSQCYEWFWDVGGKYLISDHTSVDLKATGHSLVKHAAANATCTADGNIEYYECTNCHERFLDAAASQPFADPDSVILPAKGHGMVHIAGTLPGCTTGGEVEHFECSQCGEWFWDDDGKQLISDHSATVLAALGHSLQKIEALDATCTEAGHQEYYVCSNCSEWFKDAEGTKPIADHSEMDLAPLGHDWGEWTTVKEPTADEDGLAERVCLNDISHHETKPLPATGVGPETLPAEGLSIEKKLLTAPAPDLGFEIGDPVTYQILVVNEGTETLYDVTVSDALSGKAWTIKMLAPGEKEIFTVEHVATEEEILAGVYEEMTSPEPQDGETLPIPIEEPPTQPVETPPFETQPVETQPVETQPVETQPAGTQPVAIQPAETQPAATQPAATQAPATAAPDKDGGSGSSEGKGLSWLWLPVAGLGGLSAGLGIALAQKKKK